MADEPQGQSEPQESWRAEQRFLLPAEGLASKQEDARKWLALLAVGTVGILAAMIVIGCMFHAYNAEDAIRLAAAILPFASGLATVAVAFYFKH